MRTYTDPDIGRCDDCGSDEGHRVRRHRIVTMMDGVTARITVWLCADCSGDRKVCGLCGVRYAAPGATACSTCAG